MNANPPNARETNESKKPADTNKAKQTRCLDLADVIEDELEGECLVREKKQESDTLDERLKKVRQQLHEKKLSALCLSGGGIRSASFALGVLQAFANRGLLDKFNYLSTVSGGGYIGGWLSAWIKNSGLDAVIAGLKREIRSPAEDTPTVDKAKDDDSDPESAPIRHLRRYSNYLTPKLGFTSADTWTVVATVVRNIFLNWLMLIPILAAVLMVPRLFVGFAIWHSNQLTDACVWGVIIVAALLCSLVTAYSATDLPRWRRVYEKGKEKGQAKGLSKIAEKCGYKFCLVPMVLSAALISLGWFWFRARFFPGAHPSFPQWGLTRFGAAWFCLAFFAASSLGGFIGTVSLGRLGKRSLKEVWPMLVTAAVGGIALWWVFTYVFGALEPFTNDAVRLNYLAFAPSLVLLVYLLMNFSYVGTFSGTSAEDREWWARSAGWILITALGWAALNALVIWGPIGWKILFQGLARDHDWIKYVVTALGGVSGIVTALFGHSTTTKAGPKKDENSQSGLWMTLGALTFIILLLVFIALSTSWALAKLQDFKTVSLPLTGSRFDFRLFYPTWVLANPTSHLIWAFVILFGGGWGLGFLINVNQFSLHAMYRSRLIRAFLGASRGQDRTPHWFTGFDPNDNADMHQLPTEKPPKLFHVVNTSMNLVGGEDLAWQERMAQSFTISPLHSGSLLTGYRPSKDYALGIGLGTAITISGAAANPNMGYHSSPLVTFLMTLFNVRLGWWVGNPRETKKKIWQSPGPRHAAWPLISEAFGQTTDKFTYVNLSDGGHFENLGLYEMVQRRCHHIVVVDAGRDTEYEFEDLGNAIRKIRIDLGIDIEIAIKDVAPAGKNKTHLARCAVGEIRYAKVDPTATDGKLLYIKPVLKENEPVDVYNYHKTHPGFPHETTNDQWFSESQLESYRMLGAYTIEKDLCDGQKGQFETLEKFFEYAEAQCKKLDRLPPSAPPPPTGSQDTPKM
jgi:hypothetical protein